jgi:hypothetical protein
MKTKNIIFLIVGAVLVYLGYMYYQQIQNRPEPTTDVESNGVVVPSVPEIMKKGYTIDEANQIQKALISGSITSY